MTSGFRSPSSVRITSHALTRARERIPEWRSLPQPDLMHRIRVDVSQAFRGGRVACRQPRWTLALPRSRRLKNRNGGTKRFVWNEAETHCYSVAEQGRGMWIVCTVYERRATAVAAA